MTRSGELVRVAGTLAAEPVSTRTRLLLAGGCALIAALMTVQANREFPFPRDFGQLWFAARTVLAGENPYPLVGRGLAFEWKWPLVYPLPAALIAIPFAPFSMPVASVLFSALCGGLFAWALMARGYGPLFGFFGAATMTASATVQWSPVLSAALVLPPLGVLLIAKPTLGAAIFAARPSWWAVVGGLLLAAVAFVMEPTWVSDWLDAVARNNRAWLPHAPYQVPVISWPGSVLALLCLARWRRPEARMMAVLACVPQTPLLYEAVPLFFVPQTFWQSAVLVGGSHLVHRLLEGLMPEPRVWAEYMDFSGHLIGAFLYVPATAMVLRRPNEGSVPAWLEKRLARWPSWLRGVPLRL